MRHGSSLNSPWLANTMTIRDIRPEIAGVATYDLEFADPTVGDNYSFQPGQFNMLYLPGAGEIAISISEDPTTTGRLAHTIRVAGNVTRTLAACNRGDSLGLRGPFGTGWPMAECISRDVILVAGGIGLAPLRPLIWSLLHNRRTFGRIHLLYGTRAPQTMLYAREHQEWARRGLGIHTTVDRSAPGWKGNVGVVTLLMERLELDAGNTVVLCCGPELMMRYTAAVCINRGIPSEKIWMSMERNMQCAVGFCGHCQLGPDFVCKDGPVFRYDHLSSFMDVEEL